MTCLLQVFPEFKAGYVNLAITRSYSTYRQVMFVRVPVHPLALSNVINTVAISQLVGTIDVSITPFVCIIPTQDLYSTIHIQDAHSMTIHDIPTYSLVLIGQDKIKHAKHMVSVSVIFILEVSYQIFGGHSHKKNKRLYVHAGHYLYTRRL